MKIIITEEQYRMLNEGYEKIPRINSLCQQSKKRKVENSPFCRLQNLRSRIKNEYLVSRPPHADGAGPIEAEVCGAQPAAVGPGRGARLGI
jgi:hypothetical protein